MCVIKSRGVPRPPERSEKECQYTDGLERRDGRFLSGAAAMPFNIRLDSLNVLKGRGGDI